MTLEIDFTPSWYRERLAEAKGRCFRIVGLLIIAVLVLVWGWDFTACTQAAMRELSTLKNTVKVQEGMMARLDALALEHLERDEHARLLADVGGGVLIADMVSELTHLMPKSIRLRSLRLNMAHRIRKKEALAADGQSHKDATLEEEPKTRLEILGWALSGGEVGVLVKRLAESPLFLQVDLRYERSDTAGDRRFVEFLIAATMVEFE